MSPRQRSIGKWGGAAIAVAALFGVASVLWKPTAEATGLATKDYVQRTVSDSIRAHRVDDRPWRDSVTTQVQAIRCNVDTAYRGRHPDVCDWRVAP